MGLLIILLIVVVVLVCKSSYNTGNTAPSTTSTSPTVVPKVSPAPLKAFDENDPAEIWQLANLLALLVGNARGDYLNVHLGDPDPNKGLSAEMAVGVYIDGWSNFANNDVASYKKFGLSDADAYYLASVPFKMSANGFNYQFKAIPEYPSAYRSIVISDMRDGISQSNNMRPYEIKEYRRLISLEFV